MTLYKSAKEALAAIQTLGKARGNETFDQILVLSFMAGMYVWIGKRIVGMYIALGGYVALLTGGNVPQIKETNPGLQKLIFGTRYD